MLYQSQLYKRIARKILKRQIKSECINIINNTLRIFGANYNIGKNLLKTQCIILDSKILSQLAKQNPYIFKKLFFSRRLN